MITNVKNELDIDLNKNDGIVLIDFYADWCGPCKMMTPVLENVNDIYPNITILKINVDNFKELSLKHDVSNIPTLDIYERGQKKNRQVGYVPEKKLLDILESDTSFKKKL
jgi:thioredoxin 1